MKTFFKCANCNGKTDFSVPTQITLVCQKCGCADISFDTALLIQPVRAGEKLEKKVVQKDEYILGTHKLGQMWIVEEAPIMPSVVKEELMVDKDMGTVEKDTLQAKEVEEKPTLLIRRKK